MKNSWFKTKSIFLILISPIIVEAQVHKYELDNGLKLLVKEDHRAPVVVTQIWYKVGSSYEHDGITGISHALEHMMFKGTERFAPGEFSRIIAENGGRDNAFTGPDYTSYFQTLEKSKLPISFELEADRMQNLKLSDEEFIKEIEVVKEERRWRTEDNPQSFLYEAIKAAAFQTSPYRFPVIGWMQDLDNMKINDLKNWYKKWYAPNNATVVVVGDVDPNDVYALAYEYFASIPSGQPVRITKQIEVPQQGTKRITVKRPAELPTLMMAYKTPVIIPNDHDGNEYDWEPYALEVLAGILDGGNSARIASRLIRGNEIAAAASASYQIASRLDNLFTLTGTPASGKSIQELEIAFRNEILNLQTYLVSDLELQRVKAQVISSDIYEKDSIFYQAMIIGILETIGLSSALADKYVERIKAVTNEQVLAVAKKYLIDDRLTIADLYPLKIEENVNNIRKTAEGNIRAH